MMTPDIATPQLPAPTWHCPSLTWQPALKRAQAAIPDHPAPKLGGRTILVVEDEMLLAMEIEMSIEEEGGTVIGPVGWLGEALTVMEANLDEIDGAVLDIDLHGQEVYPLAEKLRTNNVPFLFHTGHGDRDVLKERFEGVPVCIKPVMPGTLIDNLERIIDS